MPAESQPHVGMDAPADPWGLGAAAGIAEAPGASASVLAQLGVGPAGSDPRTTPGWTWSAAAFNVQIGNDDEYQGTFQGYSVGQKSYTFRFSLDGGSSWSLGDLNGAGSNGGVDFELAQLGVATVTTAVPEPSEYAMMIAGRVRVRFTSLQPPGRPPTSQAVIAGMFLFVV